MIFSFWLFDRHSDLIFRREWNAEKQLAAANSTDDVAKLVFGIVLSLRNMSRKISGDDSFLSFRTTKYKLHFFETPSNLKLVFLTDPMVHNLSLALRQIYSTLYVEYVVKNPLAPIEHAGGSTVGNEMFVMGLDAFVTGLPGFSQA